MAEGTPFFPGLVGGLFALSVLHHSIGTLSPSGVNYEVVGLEIIKAALQDPHDVLVGWDRNSVDPCGWRMVTCNPDGYVATLALDFGLETNQKGTMLDWAIQLEEGKLRQLVDKKLQDDISEIELENMAKVALSCTRHNPFERPKMSEVLNLLEEDRSSEKREASRAVHLPGSQSCDFPEFTEAMEEYSLMEAMELSGPRGVR